GFDAGAWSALPRQFQPVAGADLHELFQIGIDRRHFPGQVGEELRGAEPRRHRDHFGAAAAETEPMHGARGKVDERAGRSGRRFGADAEVDLALDDVEGLVPGMAVRWGPLPSGPRWRKTS